LERVVEWLVGGLVFEEREGDFDEFVEDGDDDGHFGFAVLSESIGEGFEAWVVAAGDDGGHVKDPSEVAVTLVADGSCGADRGA